MEMDELVAALVGVPSDSTDPTIDWDHRGDLWTELATKAGELVSSVVPEAWCTAQEWDNRVDCSVKLRNGMIVGEMISLRELSRERLCETADRLRRKLAGEEVQLISEILPPTYIGGPLPKVH
jgi:hypothetical protein